ncbi:P-loop containing nucleoside triphosphate hydrolase protein [Lactifluus volemus]|nr:P-loop containing nucleoside triphosphate hydrolase protein [Lactifluus volemus]
MLSQSLDTCITLVQGPPGTGKTTVIATYVISAINAGKRGIWLMSQSNVAVKNIAEKLVKLGFLSFKLIVSQTFHYQWHEHLYTEIKNNMIVSGNIPRQSALKKALQGSQVILCTLDMVSNPRLQELGLTKAVPILNVIIDEASQIEVSQYVPLFKAFGNTLRKMCFIGDDKQYRMPPEIGDFISDHVYNGILKSNPRHRVKPSTIACHFIDINGREQLDKDGKSSFQEVEAIVLLAQHLQDEDIPYRIITPYDAQRSVIEKALESNELNWHDKCFNVDSFQGNEDEVIIISVVRTKALGFLTSWRRTNVMLTRCKRHMYIVSNRAFLEGKGADSLVGKMAAELGKRPGAWLTQQDLENGKFN